MSAGSDASNLGYSKTFLNSNVNSNYANVYNSNWSGSFGSNEISGTPPGPLPGLSGIKNNVMAANASMMKGGNKKKCKSKLNKKKTCKNKNKSIKKNKAKRKKSKSYKK